MTEIEDFTNYKEVDSNEPLVVSDRLPYINIDGEYIYLYKDAEMTILIDTVFTGPGVTYYLTVIRDEIDGLDFIKTIVYVDKERTKAIGKFYSKP